MDDFGARLAEIRTDVGFSQSALAEAVGTSQSAISQMESGERQPSFDMLRRLAKALGVSTSHLLGGEIEGLRPEEEAHFREYRSLPEGAREELRAFARFLSQQRRKDPDR
jgi:transcriptional regulator with XRE-family HTH domain